MKRRDHWDKVHHSKAAVEVSWFQETPDLSLALIEATGIGPDARVIDVGGGVSRLVDHLLDRGFQRLSVLDISSAALDESRRRLGDRADGIAWIEADITSAAPGGPFDLWHDRAVFHFLTEPDQRRAYCAALKAAIAPGGHVIVATFAEDGPPKCSGLEVVRYSPERLHATLDPSLDLVDTRHEHHRTPAGKDQSFVYCMFRRA